jgi:hypothetical protein
MTPNKITEPGLYEMDDEAYFADPVEGGSLSSTGLKRLLEAPAIFRHFEDNPQPHKRAFDVGHAAHAEVLGTGSEVVSVDFDTYNTKAAKEARDAAYAAGKVPLLAKEVAEVKAMVEVLRADPYAGPIFDGTGVTEQVAIWADRETGQMCRAKWDYAKRTADGRLVIVDYKTTKGAVDRETLGKTLVNYGYHISAAHYRTGAMSLGLGDEATTFVLVFQQKEAPYLVTVGYVSARSLLWGEVLARAAIDRYRRAVAADYWPGYEDGIVEIDIPNWADFAYERAHEAGAYTTLEDIAS